MECGSSKSNVDTKETDAAVRCNENELFQNFNETNSESTVERRVKDGRKQKEILRCPTLHPTTNTKTEILYSFDDRVASCFISIQGKKCYCPFFVHPFETEIFFMEARSAI